MELYIYVYFGIDMTIEDDDIRIMHPPQIDIGLQFICDGVCAAPMQAVLHKRRYKPFQSQVSYRVLNHWATMGLIEDQREQDAQTWRLFSLIDLLWIRVLLDLRNFGLSLAMLQRVKQTLHIGKKGAYPVLDVAVGLCLKREPTYIVVFEDGYAALATNDSLEFSDAVIGQQNYIRININRLFREITGDKEKKFVPLLPAKISLNGKQLDVIAALEEQGIDEITIRKQRDKITMIDITKHVDGAASINECAEEIGFGDIGIRVEKGKQRYTKITKHRKL